MATCREDHKEENLHILLKAQCYFDKCEVLAPVWPVYDWIHHYRHYRHYPHTGAALCPGLLLPPNTIQCQLVTPCPGYVGWGPMGVIICHSACYHRLSLWCVIGRGWSRDLNTGLWLAAIRPGHRCHALMTGGWIRANYRRGIDLIEGFPA